MSDAAPVEVTTRYVTSVEALADAWSFVMDRIDSVGPEPSVRIVPKHIFSVSEIDDPDAQGLRCFEVVVEGMVHEATS